MRQVKHRSAAGHAGEAWGYDPNRCVVELFVHVAGKGLGVLVPVCSQQHPRAGAWVIVRLSESEWRLTPALWPPKADDIAKATPFHPLLPPESIALLAAPDSVCLALEAL